MNRMPLTGIWPEPVVTAMTWIIANRLAGAKASDLDVDRIRIHESKAAFSHSGDYLEVAAHRIRGDLGKRHLLVDGRGVPFSLVVTGANEHDVTQLDQVLTAIMVKRKSPGTGRKGSIRPVQYPLNSACLSAWPSARDK